MDNLDIKGPAIEDISNLEESTIPHQNDETEEVIAAELIPQNASLQPSMESVNESLATLADSLMQFDATVASTQSIRNQLMVKFLPDILNLDMKVDKSTDPDQYASQTRFLGEFRQLLNDMDSSSKNHVAVKLKQKDMEMQHTHSVNAAELLAKIQFSNGVPVSNLPFTKTQQEIDSLIETQFQDSGCVVFDTELETGNTSLPEKKVSDEF